MVKAKRSKSASAGPSLAPHQPAGKPTRPPTEFESRLFELCKRIPAGKVSTYGAMAAALNSSARAVGQGMRRNPYAPVVPCHRVVASDLDLGGFSGSWGAHTCNVQRKKGMLEAEGVAFSGSKVASKAYVLSADDLRAVMGGAAAAAATGSGKKAAKASKK